MTADVMLINGLFSGVMSVKSPSAVILITSSPGTLELTKMGYCLSSLEKIPLHAK